MTFTELQLIQPLCRAVADAGYQTPSAIQTAAIPPLLAGKDLLGCAQTGSGKTAAFALPILQRLSEENRQNHTIRALVLSPTRELALQIQESFVLYAKYLKLRSAVIFGGVKQGLQTQALKKGIDILVATPGRFLDLYGQGLIRLSDLEIFVLDEADRMLDMGFINDVRKTISYLPETRQTMLFSATMPKEIEGLANSILHNPVSVKVDSVSKPVDTVEQSLYRIEKTDKRALLAELLKQNCVESALVFTRTKHGADRVVKQLKQDGIIAMAIHGDKSQNARQAALNQFKNRKIYVLVATDIAARGIDINDLSHVINYDLPNEPETYIHRIGRTARAGKEGKAISFCASEEDAYRRDIEKLMSRTIPVVHSTWDRPELPEQEITPARKPRNAGQNNRRQSNQNRRKTNTPKEKPVEQAKPQNQTKSTGQVKSPNKNRANKPEAKKPSERQIPNTTKPHNTEASSAKPEADRWGIVSFAGQNFAPKQNSSKQRTPYQKSSNQRAATQKTSTQKAATQNATNQSASYQKASKAQDDLPPTVRRVKKYPRKAESKGNK